MCFGFLCCLWGIALVQHWTPSPPCWNGKTIFLSRRFTLFSLRLVSCNHLPMRNLLMLKGQLSQNLKKKNYKNSLKYNWELLGEGGEHHCRCVENSGSYTKTTWMCEDLNAVGGKCGQYCLFKLQHIMQKFMEDTGKKKSPRLFPSNLPIVILWSGQSWFYLPSLIFLDDKKSIIHSLGLWTWHLTKLCPGRFLFFFFLSSHFYSRFSFLKD